MTQHSHQSSNFEIRKFPVILILDRVISPANIGSLFRLADAFNVEKIISCGAETDLESNRLKRTARATVKNVIFESWEETLTACDEVLKDDYILFALEITEDSVPVDTVDFSAFQKVALVLGNENSGVEAKVLSKASGKLHISMFGKNSSMNVSHAAAIALFQITKSLQPI